MPAPQRLPRPARAPGNAWFRRRRPPKRPAPRGRRGTGPHVSRPAGEAAGAAGFPGPSTASTRPGSGRRWRRVGLGPPVPGGGRNRAGTADPCRRGRAARITRRGGARPRGGGCSVGAPARAGAAPGSRQDATRGEFAAGGTKGSNRSPGTPTRATAFATDAGRAEALPRGRGRSRTANRPSLSGMHAPARGIPRAEHRPDAAGRAPARAIGTGGPRRRHRQCACPEGDGPAREGGA